MKRIGVALFIIIGIVGCGAPGAGQESAISETPTDPPIVLTAASALTQVARPTDPPIVLTAASALTQVARPTSTIEPTATSTVVPVSPTRRSVTTTPFPTQTPGPATNTPSPSTPTQPSDPTAPPTEVVVVPTVASSSTSNGIAFGKLLNLSIAGINTSAILVTNNDTTVKTFTVKATWKTGDTISATASGAVSDLLPGQTRPVMLVTMDAIPEGEPRIDVDTMVQDVASTPGSEAASKISFGAPKMSSMAGFGSVDVEVTNADDRSHTLTLVAIFMRGEEFVGLANGAINDLGAGQTKTASLIAQGTIEGADVIVMVDTLVQ